MKKIKLLVMFAAAAVLLTGCIDYMPDMTEEESELVAEYAAGLLLKYSPNYDYMLVSDDELAAALEEEAQEEIQEEETQEEETQEQESVEEPESAPETEQAALPEDADTEQTQEQEEIQGALASDAELAAELGLDDGISLRYQTYELCGAYPKNASGYSGIEAKEGKTLLVLHFMLSNTTDEEIDCQIYDAGLKLKASVNQLAAVSASDTSMLPADMLTYVGSVEKGEALDVTAVVEITAMPEDEIETITIQLSSSYGSCNVRIK